MKTPIAININFDSLGQNLGYPRGFYDPSFFKVFDRFLEYSDKYKFKYSIFIIGKDLENKDVFTRVREWSQSGHEIGNHSYSHIQNLGIEKLKVVEYEILKSHELILNCTGKEPRGFICPGWAASDNILKVLIKNNYLYDTSLFPSIFTYAVVLKNIINYSRTPSKLKRILLRRDYAWPFIKSTKPFISDAYYNRVRSTNREKIIELPLPTIHRFTGCMWHTVWFIFGLKYSQKRLKEYLDNYEYFYYLMHPADLISKSDSEKISLSAIERIEWDVKIKRNFMNMAFDLIAESQRPIVTLEKLAEDFLAHEIAEGR